jgi:hypothetical protein
MLPTAVDLTFTPSPETVTLALLSRFAPDKVTVTFFNPRELGRGRRPSPSTHAIVIESAASALLCVAPDSVSTTFTVNL